MCDHLLAQAVSAIMTYGYSPWLAILSAQDQSGKFASVMLYYYCYTCDEMRTFVVIFINKVNPFRINIDIIDAFR